MDGVQVSVELNIEKRKLNFQTNKEEHDSDHMAGFEFGTTCDGDCSLQVNGGTGR